MEECAAVEEEETEEHASTEKEVDGGVCHC